MAARNDERGPDEQGSRVLAGDARELTMATRALKNGRIVWSVSEPAIGSVLVVDVDDETATVINVRRVGLR